jgi:limonene-1,2-epoxide hydrolase
MIVAIGSQSFRGCRDARDRPLSPGLIQKTFDKCPFHSPGELAGCDTRIQQFRIGGAPRVNSDDSQSQSSFREVCVSTPVAIVSGFFDAWSEGRISVLQSIRDFFTEDAVWENVGIAFTVGPDEAITFFSEALDTVQCDHMDVEMLHIAAAGNVVLTERIDRFVDFDGRTTESVRVMGILEIRDGRISAWRDYFDPRPFLAMAGQS